MTNMTKEVRPNLPFGRFDTSIPMEWGTVSGKNLGGTPVGEVLSRLPEGEWYSRYVIGMDVSIVESHKGRLGFLVWDDPAIPVEVVELYTSDYTDYKTRINEYEKRIATLTKELAEARQTT